MWLKFGDIFYWNFVTNISDCNFVNIICKTIFLWNNISDSNSDSINSDSRYSDGSNSDGSNCDSSASDSYNSDSNNSYKWY